MRDVCLPTSPSIDLQTLRKRRDFVSLSLNAKKIHLPAFVLLAQQRDPNAPTSPNTETTVIRVGLTVSRRVGKATIRNRVKRRLRAAVTEIFRHEARATPGWDYVLIGRRDISLKRDFAALVKDLRYAIRRLQKSQRRARSSKIDPPLSHQPSPSKTGVKVRP